MFYPLYALGWIFALLPLRILYLLSDLFYPVVYYIVGYRKSVVRTNLENSFPDKTKNELRKIERSYYRFFCDLFVESIHEIHFSDAESKRRFIFVGIDKLQEQYKNGKGIMVMTAHYGNWEWGRNFPLFTPEEMPSYQIYKQLSNDRFDKLMYQLRSKYGGVNVEKRDLLRSMVKARSEDKQGIYWMISDQTPAEKKIHHWTEFLNQQTPTLTGTEQLARKFNYPVFYAEIKRIKRGYYTCTLIPVSLNPSATAEYEITDKYMKLLENTIQEAPAYWLWSHRRWKFKHKETQNI